LLAGNGCCEQSPSSKGGKTVRPVWIAILILIATSSFGQAPSESVAPTATMRQLMLDMIYPASNDLLLLINRGGPRDEAEWAAVRRAAMALSESGNSLMLPERMRDQGDWLTHVKMLVDVGAAAYKAAAGKDAQALAAVAGPLDASCTSCHKLYRPNVFPRQGGTK
jgi:cytochrome c556